MTHAPHLPEQSHKTSNFWGGVKWILFITVLAVFAGSMSALTIIGAYAPLLQNGQTIILGQKNNEDSAPILSDSARSDLNKRVMDVYSGQPQFGSVYTQDAYVGTAVMLSSGGWSAMHYSGTQAPAVSSLTGIDYQGILHEATEVVYDRQEDVLFVKFEGENYLVSSFTTWGQVHSEDYVWVRDAQWDAVMLDTYNTQNSRFDITVYSDSYAADVGNESGNPVFDVQGNFVGFTGEQSVYMGWRIQDSLEDILLSGTIVPPTIDIDGYFVEGYIDPSSQTWKKRTGFVVVQAGKGLPLNSDDVIISVNGNNITTDDFVRVMHRVPDSFSLNVLRNGIIEEIQITQ